MVGGDRRSGRIEGRAGLILGLVEATPDRPRVPCRRSNPRQRIALDALTPKRCAACLHESPPAIAASTRVLRSSDSAFDMSAGLRPADS